jgi:multiple sugar transport system ATP-binding protein
MRQRMATVVLRDLVKSYPEKNGPGLRVVHGINLEIKDREFMVLVGPSGCGKSTTLRMIAGLEEITGGTVSIDGRVVNDVAPKDRDIAMVFQNYALYPHMSVYENMAFGLKLRNVPKVEIDQRVKEAASMLGLESYLDRKPKALSGGQRQRVAVGRAIVRKPKVFLFDEPLSNLDAKMRVTTRTEIAKLHQRLGATMIYVTHDQVEAMTMGDRICVMKDGHIMQVAPPLELYNRPANMFVAGFIGSPAMNFFRGTVQTSAGGLSFLVSTATERRLAIPLTPRLQKLASAYSGRALVLGIRPEDIADAQQRPAAVERPRIEAAVDVCEPLGSETFLYLSAGDVAFTARVAPTAVYPTGARVTLELDLSKAHFFDPDTERVVTA